MFDSGDVEKYPVWNPRAEIPVLQDGETTIRNSATIVEYLHKRFRDAHSLLPADPRAFAVAKEWEIVADTMIDPVVTNMSLWFWAEMPPIPDGLVEAAQRDIAEIYDRLSETLRDRDYVAGAISIGDVALYPQIHGAQHTNLAIDPERHQPIAAWLERMKSSAIGRADFAEVVKWWKNKDNQDVDTKKINWGTYRLEWFLANGFHDFFLNEIQRGAVLWSVGPNNNARNLNSVAGAS